jgi:hypothetical protein
MSIKICRRAIRSRRREFVAASVERIVAVRFSSNSVEHRRRARKATRSIASRIVLTTSGNIKAFEKWDFATFGG